MTFDYDIRYYIVPPSYYHFSRTNASKSHKQTAKRRFSAFPVSGIPALRAGIQKHPSYFLCKKSLVFLACVNKAAFIFSQAMGKAAASTMLSMVREIVFGVGFAVILPVFFGLDGVLYSMPASDILTAAISAIVIVGAYRQLSGRTNAISAKAHTALS